jgi:hypothetical protein
MLERIELELATAAPIEKSRLRRRAELIRRLLTPNRPAREEGDEEA